MYIDGFAYKPDESELRTSRQKRLTELKGQNIWKYITVNSKYVKYAKHEYVGEVSNECPVILTPLDILLYLDDFCLVPFGGTCNYITETGKFYATIYTD